MNQLPNEIDPDDLDGLPLDLVTLILRQLIHDQRRDYYGTLHTIMRHQGLINTFRNLSPLERINIAGTSSIRTQCWLTQIRQDPAYIAMEARFHRMIPNWNLTYINRAGNDCLEIAIWFMIPGNLQRAHTELLADICTEYFNHLRTWENRLNNAVVAGNFPPPTSLGRAIELDLGDRWMQALDTSWGNAAAITRNQAIRYLWNQDRTEFARHGRFHAGIHAGQSLLAHQLTDSVFLLLSHEIDDPSRYVTLSNLNLSQHQLPLRIASARTAYMQYWNSWWSTGRWTGPSLSAGNPAIASYTEFPGPGPLGEFPAL